MEKKGEDAVSFVYGAEYNEGDVIILETIPANKHIVWRVDDALGAAMCYVTGLVTYQIPFGEKKYILRKPSVAASIFFLQERQRRMKLQHIVT